jgi:hypothetical protein
MPRRVVVVHLWQIAVAFIAITLAFVAAAGWLTHQQREIQRQRITSCKHTYEGVREIFRPFFRPAPARTTKERHDIRKFNRIVDQLKAQCDKQITTKGTR